MSERIVSACNMSPDGLIVMCVRHGCGVFFGVVDEIYKDKSKHYHDWQQGFVTNSGRYVDRFEAWVIAEKANQIIRKESWNETSSGYKLYSENLY